MQELLWRRALAAGLAAVTGLVAGCANENLVRKTDRQVEAAKPVLSMPATPFNAKDAAAALAPGKANIEGVLFHVLTYEGDQTLNTSVARLVNRPTKAGRVVVTLYPVQPHLQEWLQLKDEDDGIRRSPLKQVMNLNRPPQDIRYDEAVERYRRQATSDDNGRYSFRQLKPGRYLLVAEAEASGSYLQTVQTGTSTYSGLHSAGTALGMHSGTVQHFTDETRNYRRRLGYRQVVEVSGAAQVLEVESELRVR